MASTPTANFGYNKPAEGDTDWDTTLNNNFDAIDADLFVEHNADGTHKAAAGTTLGVLLADGTITGATSQQQTFTNGIIVNESGADSDTRFEGSGNANLLYLDAGNNYVGVTRIPGLPLDVGGSGTVARFGDATGASYIRIYANAANSAQIHFGDADDTNVGQISYSHVTNSMSLYTNATEHFKIDSAGSAYIGDQSNANMTVGLTINQGANDDEIFSLKSSDVAHGYTTGAETDTYFSIKKMTGATGGAHIKAFHEDTAASRVLNISAYGATANTTKSTAGLGIINFYASEHDGANALANITANGNIFSIQARVGGADVTRWLLDEDGDTWQSGSLHIQPGSSGVTANGNANNLIVERNGVAGLSIITPNTVNNNIFFGDPEDDNAGGFQYNHAADSLAIRVNGTEAAFIDSDLAMYLNDTTNANMTKGLTINQGANDDEIFSLKSSDISHGYTTGAETDTYFAIQKSSAAAGGTLFSSFAEDDVQLVSTYFKTYGATADTGKTASDFGLFTFYAAEHDGANSLANITADGNIFAVRARVGAADVTNFIIDEDGDLHANGGTASTDMVTQFDEYDDAALIRAFDHARNAKGLIRDEWDEFVRYNEADLVDAGILGDTLENGGLVNVTQLQRLQNGAIWQQETRLKQLEQIISQQAAQIEALSTKLLEA